MSVTQTKMDTLDFIKNKNKTKQKNNGLSVG